MMALKIWLIDYVTSDTWIREQQPAHWFESAFQDVFTFFTLPLPLKIVAAPVHPSWQHGWQRNGSATPFIFPEQRLGTVSLLLLQKSETPALCLRNSNCVVQLWLVLWGWLDQLWHGLQFLLSHTTFAEVVNWFRITRLGSYPTANKWNVLGFPDKTGNS